MLGLLNTAHVSKQTPVVSRQTLQHILYIFFYTCGLNSWLVFTKPLVNAGIRAESCTVYFKASWFTEGKTAFTDLINQLALNAIVQCIWSKPAAQPWGDLTTIYRMKLQHSYNSTWKAQQEKKQEMCHGPNIWELVVWPSTLSCHVVIVDIVADK